MKHLLAVLTAAALLASASARAETVRSDYSVSLYGLTLARLQFKNTIEADRFEVKGSLSSAGLGAVFDDTDGKVSTQGSFAGSVPQPLAYRVDYKTGKKTKMTAVAFKGGNVISAVNQPEVNTKRKHWVPVKPADLAGVADPLSAMLVRTSDPRQVCGRTFHVFDGAMRADIRLSYASMRKVSMKGYQGDAVVCSARFEPISGYRTSFKSIQWLQKSTGISITFAPIGSTGVYAPVGASVGTQIGTVTVRANKFQTGD